MNEAALRGRIAALVIAALLSVAGASVSLAAVAHDAKAAIPERVGDSSNY
jgi:hypothetical protein